MVKETAEDSMRRSANRILARLVLASGLALTSSGSATSLAPYKDDLFAYPQPVASRAAGAFLDVPYDEARDIDRRDEIPERRVQRRYVDLEPNRTRQEHLFETGAGPLRWTSVGESSAPRFVVVFVHGRNGDRRLGMNDWTFGGNFNRLKNLALRNAGLYVTFDGGMLGAEDARHAGMFIRELAARREGAPVLLACGSMGGELCWTALADPEVAHAVDGLIVLGGSSDVSRLDRAVPRGRMMPILVAHGTRDKVYDYGQQEAFVKTVRAQRPGYPIRFVGFDGGNHGTPIRMIDWRETLDWMLAQ
jgi:acetyl esterase/lipase